MGYSGYHHLQGRSFRPN